MNELNQDWVTTLKEAEKSGEGIDLSAMVSKVSQHQAQLDDKFSEARQRMTKKKGWGRA